MNKFSYLLVIFTLLITACADPCKDVVCGDNGTCDEGLCACDIGVYGDNCENLYRDDFVGDWSMLSHECSNGTSGSFIYSFSVGEKVNEVEIRSSVTPNLLLIGEVDGNIVTIPSQVLFFGVNVTISGSGTLVNENSMELELISAADGQAELVCNSVLFKP